MIVNITEIYCFSYTISFFFLNICVIDIPFDNFTNKYENYGLKDDIF